MVNKSTKINTNLTSFFPHCTHTYNNTHIHTALVVGNVHFTTLDGFNYTFNGLGDYLLLNDTNSAFQVQVRTKEIESESYSATQLDSLALGEEGSVVKVCLVSGDVTSHFANVTM